MAEHSPTVWLILIVVPVHGIVSRADELWVPDSLEKDLREIALSRRSARNVVPNVFRSETPHPKRARSVEKRLTISREWLIRELHVTRRGFSICVPRWDWGEDFATSGLIEGVDCRTRPPPRTRGDKVIDEVPEPLVNPLAYADLLAVTALERDLYDQCSGLHREIFLLRQIRQHSDWSAVVPPIGWPLMAGERRGRYAESRALLGIQQSGGRVVD